MPKNPSKRKSKEGFAGFEIPEQNWFKVPHLWIDISAHMTLAEAKVVLYVLRHTWGFSEYDTPKKITIDEFRNGRKRRDGSRFDSGTGLARSSVILGLRDAAKNGYLEEFINDDDKGRVRKFYRLRMMRTSDTGVRKSDPRARESDTGVRKGNLRGSKFIHRTEKDTSRKTVTVSGPQKSNLKTLPDLDQAVARTKDTAEQTLKQLGDRHSMKYYQLVAAKVPEAIIWRALAEINADGANEPSKVFTYRMEKYALGQQKKAA